MISILMKEENKMSTRRKQVKETMDQLINHTNCMTGEQDVIQGMVDSLTSNHRTLQQSFVRCVVAALVEYSECKTDLRNESAVDFAKKVKELDLHFPFI